MDEKTMQKEYWSELLTAALVLGLINAVIMVLGYVFKDGGSQVMNWLLNIATFAGIFWVLLQYGKRASRLDKFRKTGFSYGSAFGFSILMLFISGILTGTCQWILQTVIDPKYGEELLRTAINAAEKTGVAVDDQQIAMIKMMTNSIWWIIGASMLSMVMLGGLVALVTSTFVKRPGNPFADEDDALRQGDGNENND